ncbi:MAG: phosphate transport system substrate-binding protein [Candidatus Eremiobacteraeota bacterium]|nr:phosphate transport system substrate-binding protein [Candidatus Eremiobacteraeota bacterium]
MKRKPARAALHLGVVLASIALAACSSSSKTQDAGASGPGSGTITVAGSTAMLPLVKDASAAYQEQHKNVKISVSGGGSATGINQVAAKAIDVGDSDITAPNHPELVDHRVAVVGFAVVTNPTVGVKGLSKQQLRDVFAGNVANWKDVGGADQKIVVVNRPRSSGTRAVFVKTIMGTAPLSESGLVEDATGTVVSVVKQTPGSVSYVALSGVTAGGVAIVAVDGVAPSVDTIVSGKYPIWSYEHMFTNGEAKGEVAAFIDYVSARTDLVQKNKFIAVSAMKVKESDR